VNIPSCIYMHRGSHVLQIYMHALLHYGQNTHTICIHTHSHPINGPRTYMQRLLKILHPAHYFHCVLGTMFFPPDYIIDLKELSRSVSRTLSSPCSLHQNRYTCLKVRSHQKRNYFFARPNPMRSQCTDACGCDRRDIFPGDAFGATRCGRRVFSGAIFAPR